MHRNRRDDSKSLSEFKSNFEFIIKKVQLYRKFVEFNQKLSNLIKIVGFSIKIDRFSIKFDYFRLINRHWIYLNRLKDQIYIENDRL